MALCITSFENDILFSDNEKLYNQLILIGNVSGNLLGNLSLNTDFTLELIYCVGNLQYILLKNNINTYIYGQLNDRKIDIKYKGSKIKITDYQFNQLNKCYNIKLKVI